MEAILYTPKEITSALSILETRLQDKVDARKFINSEIRDIKTNIKYYEELDSSQYKLI